MEDRSKRRLCLEYMPSGPLPKLSRVPPRGSLILKKNNNKKQFLIKKKIKDFQTVSLHILYDSIDYG